MFRRRMVALTNWRQTLALCIVWSALAGSAGLCLLAPLSLKDEEQSNGRGLATIMISLASKAF